MDNDDMGRVTTEATIENLDDLYSVKKGLIATEKVRRAEVSEALVDTSATLLSVPTRLIKELGLSQVGTKRVISS